VRCGKQLVIEFPSANAGGTLFYTGRDMATANRGMKISQRDGSVFSANLRATFDAFRVPPVARDAVIGFVGSTKPDIVEA